MAHVSAQESQVHMATAFHFLISKRGAGGAFLPPAAAAAFFLSAEEGLASAAASDISTSSLVFFLVSTIVAKMFLGYKKSSWTGASVGEYGEDGRQLGVVLWQNTR